MLNKYYDLIVLAQSRKNTRQAVKSRQLVYLQALRELNSFVIENYYMHPKIYSGSQNNKTRSEPVVFFFIFKSGNLCVKLWHSYISPMSNKFVLSDTLNSFNTSVTLLKLCLLLTTAFMASYSSECPLTKPGQNQTTIQRRTGNRCLYLES